MNKTILDKLNDSLDHSITLEDNLLKIKDKEKFINRIDDLVKISVFGSKDEQGIARYIIRSAAQELGIFPASINDLYFSRGRGEIANTFTVPAINLRALSFDAAKAVFRAARPLNAGSFIFEIARSEMGYTYQRPSEYVSNILAAAIAEKYEGPVFIQGDHFQVSLKRFMNDRDSELKSIRDLIIESLAAGFFNIDIDTSTLVDLSKTTIPEQQFLNTTLSASFTDFIRQNEPVGITVSVGGEIGEVGGHNSTEEELRSYMDGYNEELKKLNPDAIGLSKISIQTGTSHGGVVLPDGTIAKVKVDFDTLKRLSKIARDEYGMGGAVQHGASTLPEDAFGHFVEAEAIEVHLATNFQNMMFDRIPVELKTEIYAYLDKNHANERKPEMTDEQFHYKTRKRALGQFKKELWNMPEDVRKNIADAWQDQFSNLFNLLGLKDTYPIVKQYISKTIINPDPNFYLGKEAAAEDVSDLAD